MQNPFLNYSDADLLAIHAEVIEAEAYGLLAESIRKETYHLVSYGVSLADCYMQTYLLFFKELSRRWADMQV